MDITTLCQVLVITSFKVSQVRDRGDHSMRDGQDIIRKLIVSNVLGECNVPCTLKNYFYKE